MVKTVSSSTQMAKSLQENSEITNFLRVLLRKKMELLIKELLKMDKNMEEVYTL